MVLTIRSEIIDKAPIEAPPKDAAIGMTRLSKLSAGRSI